MHTFSFKNGERKAGWITRIEGDKIWVIFENSQEEKWFHPAELTFGFRPTSYVKSVISAVLNIPKFRIFHNGQLNFWVPVRLTHDQLYKIEARIKVLNLIVDKWDRGRENTILKLSTTVP